MAMDRPGDHIYRSDTPLVLSFTLIVIFLFTYGRFPFLSLQRILSHKHEFTIGSPIFDPAGVIPDVGRCYPHTCFWQ